MYFSSIMMWRCFVGAFLLSCGFLLAEIPAVPNSIPNVTQVPGTLLFRSPTTQNRITNIAYHNGTFYTHVVTGSDRKVWRFGNTTAASSFAQDTTRNNDNIPLFNESGNHTHAKVGDYLGGAYDFSIKRLSVGVNTASSMPEYATLTHYSTPGLVSYWPWKVPFHWIQYAAQGQATPTTLVRPNLARTAPETKFSWNSLAEDGVTGNSILLGNLLFITSDESAQGILCYDISPTFKTPAERPLLLDKLVGAFGAYIAVPFQHYLVLSRQASDMVEVIDFSDPTDLKHVASINLAGTAAWKGDTSVTYTQAQDNYIFTKRHKVDMDSFTPVLQLSESGVGRPSGSVTGAVETSQYMKPIGNLIITSGYSFPESDRLGVWAHQAAPDTKKPYVGYHVPRPGQTNFPVGAPISLLVHEAIESYTIVNGESLILREVGTTTPLDCWTSIADNGVITMTPKAYLLANKNYEVVVVNGGIKDALNNGIEPYTFTFSTGSTASGGNAAPTITTFAANPSPAAINQTVNFNIVASDPESNPLQYRFTHGDGTAATAWGSNSTFSRTYSTAGHYTAKLQVRDTKPDGSTSVVSKDLTVTVGNLPTGTLPTNSSTIALNASTRRVWSANADSDTVSVINADTNAKVAEYNLTTLLGITGSVDPRNVAIDSSGNVWVTCHDADRIVVLNSSGSLLGQISTGYGSAPLGLAITPNGSQAFVTLTGSGVLKRYATSTRAETGTLNLGPTPRALAITGDGTNVLVTRYISAANFGTVWNVTNEPTLTVGNAYSLTRNLTPDSASNGRGIPNQLVGITLSPDSAKAWVTCSKMNDEHGTFFVGGAANTDNAVRAMVVQLDLNSINENHSNRLDVDNSESPTSVSFSALGDWAFVTLQGNNEVAVYDEYSLQISTSAKVPKWRFSADLAPQGQVYDATTRKLFVNNFMARNISIHDLTSFITQGARSNPIVKTSVVSTEKLSGTVLLGKQAFYNASLKNASNVNAMSRDNYISCATCHTDGAQDGRVWDFTQRGEGFRNTIDLRGRSGMGHGNVHWSANFDEIQDFEHDLRDHFGAAGLISATTISTPLGAPKAGASATLDALAAYVTSLNRETVPKSPLRQASGALSANATAGQSIFNAQSCTTCHGGSNLTDSALGTSVKLHDVGTMRTSSGKRMNESLTGIDTPTLAGIHATAPYFHDGSAKTLSDVFKVGGGKVYQLESATISGGVFVPRFVNINHYNQVQGTSLIDWNGQGSWSLANVDGGSGGMGAIEFRFTAGSTKNITLTVNSSTYPVQFVGKNGGWQYDNYEVARVENVQLNAGLTNTISSTGTVDRLGIDSMTVTTASELTKALPHRRVLALNATDQANLIQYLLELDGTNLGGQVVIAPVVGSGQTVSGTSGTAINSQILASNSPTSYALTSGALPSGVTLDTSTGILSGTPTNTGTFTPTFTATNSAGTSPAVSVSITINAAAVTPVVTANQIATGTVNATFSYSILASNSPTSYSLASGTLPAGLSLNLTSGLISGTPTTAGTFSPTFTASNGAGNSATVAISLQISATSGGSQLLTGTSIGTPGAWSGNPSATGDKAFDGNTATYFDATEPTGAWTGLDLGIARQISHIRFYPRADLAGRMVGGQFQGSNSADFMSGVVTFHTVSATPAMAYMTVAVADTSTYRYVRYLSPTDGFGNVAEVAFYSPASTSTYEGFAYTAGTGALANKSGGSNWNGTWDGGANNINATGSTYTSSGTLLASGGKAVINNSTGSFRSLSAADYGNGTYWIAFLAKSSLPGTNWGGVSLFNGTTESLFIGQRLTQTNWGVERSGNNTGINSLVNTGSTAFILVKVVLQAGNDVVYLWINPSLASSPLDSAAVLFSNVNDFTFNRIRLMHGLGAGQTLEIDELRVGNSYAEVAPLAITPTPILTFRRNNGLAPDGSQDLMTPAGDGVPNLFKFAFNMIGTGVSQAITVSIPNAKTLVEGGIAGLPLLGKDISGKLTLTYIRRKASTDPGVSYAAEFANGLSSWSTNPSATESAVSIDLSFERVTVTDSSTSARRFVRLKISSF